MKKLFLRAGHGGKDSGAVFGNLVEKLLNLVVITKVAQLLTGKFEIMLARANDVFIDLDDAVVMANNWGADIFVSVHHNAGGGDGYEVYHSLNSLEGTKLATALAKYFAASGQNPHGNGVRTRESELYPGKDYYCELRYTNMPAIISEYAYIDSSDNQIIDSMPELDSEAIAIAKGICEYAGVPFEVSTIPVVPKPSSPTSMDTSIAVMQRALNRLKINGANGLSLTVDGKQGPNTTYAIRILQYITNISVDGYIGPKTLDAVLSIIAKPICKLNDAPILPTRYLQWRLGLTKDGQFGPKTEAAIKLYQSHNGLVADGEVGPKTWTKLIG